MQYDGERVRILDDLAHPKARVRDNAVRRAVEALAALTDCANQESKGEGPRCSGLAKRWGKIVCKDVNDDLIATIEALDDESHVSSLLGKPEFRKGYRGLQHLFAEVVADLIGVSCPEDCPVVADLKVDIGTQWTTTAPIQHEPEVTRILVIEYEITWKCENATELESGGTTTPRWPPRRWNSPHWFSVSHKQPMWCPDDGYVEVCITVFGSGNRIVRIPPRKKQDVKDLLADAMAQVGAEKWTCPSPCGAIQWSDTKSELKEGRRVSSYCLKKSCTCEDSSAPKSPTVDTVGLWGGEGREDSMMLSPHPHGPWDPIDTPWGGGRILTAHTRDETSISQLDRDALPAFARRMGEASEPPTANGSGSRPADTRTATRGLAIGGSVGSGRERKPPG
jgi:hypothetical protein